MRIRHAASFYKISDDLKARHLLDHESFTQTKLRLSPYVWHPIKQVSFEIFFDETSDFECNLRVDSSYGWTLLAHSDNNSIYLVELIHRKTRTDMDSWWIGRPIGYVIDNILKSTISPDIDHLTWGLYEETEY